jgi:hypothetical protein
VATCTPIEDGLVAVDGDFVLRIDGGVDDDGYTRVQITTTPQRE